MKHKVKNTLRKQDMFGHSATLFFDHDNDTHGTICGGIVSVFLKIGLFIFFFVNIKKFALREWQENQTVE